MLVNVMRVNDIAFRESMKLRGYFVSEYLKYHGPTDSDAGSTLVHYANKFDYSDRSRAIPGKTLRSWVMTKNVPQWAIKTIVRYILIKGYVPESDMEIDALLVNVIVGMEAPEVNNVHQLEGVARLNSTDVICSLNRIWHAKS